MTLKYWEMNVGWEEIYRTFFARVYNKLFRPPPLPLLCLCVSLPLSLFLSLSPSSFFPRKNSESQFPTINCLQWGSYKILGEGRTVMNSTFYFETPHMELPVFLLDLLLLQLLTDNRHSYQELGAAQRKGRPGLIVEMPRELTLDPPRPLSLILHQHAVAASPKTRCSKAPHLRVCSGSPESDRYMDTNLQYSRDAMRQLLSWWGARSMMSTRGIGKGVQESGAASQGTCRSNWNLWNREEYSRSREPHTQSHQTRDHGRSGTLRVFIVGVGEMRLGQARQSPECSVRGTGFILVMPMIQGQEERQDQLDRTGYKDSQD